MAAPQTATRETHPFPSLAWFEALARRMGEDHARHEHLGYVDCVAQFSVSDGSADGGPWSVQVTFEEFEAVDVREVGPGDATRADFALEAELATWRGMIESIAAGGGRPGLEQTLNRLSHMGTPMHLVGADPLRTDLYFRYNQSLQEFVNASATFDTSFERGA